MRKIVEDTVAQQNRWQIKDQDAWYFRFRPTEWDQFATMNSGTGWQSQSLLLCQLYCTNDNSHFYLTLSPGADQKVRRKIYETATQNPHLFNSTRSAFSEGWLPIHREENILEDADLDRWDDEDAPGRRKLRNWLSNFADQQFPAMNEVIVKCLQDYEAERSGQ